MRDEKMMKTLGEKSKNGMVHDCDGSRREIKHLMQFKTAIAFFILHPSSFILHP